MTPKSGDCVHMPEVGCGKSPMVTDEGVSTMSATPRASGQRKPHQGDDVFNEVVIRYSTDPMVTVKMDLNKCNEDILDLILIDQMIEEIQAQIDELNRKIKKYGIYLEPKNGEQE